MKELISFLVTVGLIFLASLFLIGIGHIAVAIDQANAPTKELLQCQTKK